MRVKPQLVVGFALVFTASCAPTPAAPPTQPASASRTASASPANWASIVDAAKKEGSVECACPPRPDLAGPIKAAFEKANPGITLNVSPATLPEFWVQADKEQGAGQYNWDVYTFGPTIETFDLKNKGGMSPMRDYMVGPDIGTDADWEGGLSGPFIDKDKQYIFGYLRKVGSTSIVNRDLLPNGPVGSYQDLLNPAYKDKMAWQDPRIGGAGINYATAIYSKFGMDGLKKLLVDQAPTLEKGQQETADAIVRGGKAISISDLSEDSLGEYRKSGVKLNLETVLLQDIQFVSHGGSLVLVFKNPPHPNATKVYVNWILSAQGQAVASSAQQFDSMRKDVPRVADPLRQPKSGVDYTDVHAEQNMLVTSKQAQEAAKQLVP
ncbi:MAG: extracellular solute-binding protein [Chloroflexi bacterium]|nr:extracellular solute-binding protein [Chloroflexota bacterium]